MILSLEKNEFLRYTSSQLNNFYPDKRPISPADLESVVDITFDRLNFCFKHVSFGRYFKNNQTIFNHLYADHYLMYLWFLSNTVWKETADESLSSKLYYLNKSLHGFDCMYDTKLPNIFLIFHGVGSMLGKAIYGDFFVALQGCTVGSHKGEYPVLGKGVSLTANSSIIGKCTIGERSTISSRTQLFNSNLPDDSVAYIDSNTGKLEVKRSKSVYAQQFFNVILSEL